MGKFGEISVVSERCSGCLRCALACSFFTSRERSFCLDQAMIEVTPNPKLAFQYDVRLLENCTRCGICVDHCEYSVLSQA